MEDGSRVRSRDLEMKETRSRSDVTKTDFPRKCSTKMEISVESFSSFVVSVAISSSRQITCGIEVLRATSPFGILTIHFPFLCPLSFLSLVYR
jgi:hypothetical protein